MNETIILIALIVGFFAITVFALSALLVVRRREQGRHDSKGADDVVARMDAALDAALIEINKMGTLVKKEVDEKYQSMLFLYNLVEDKKKEIEEIDAPEFDTAMLAQYLENHVSELKLTHEKVEIKQESIGEGVNPLDLLLGRDAPGLDVDLDSDANAPGENQKRPTFANPKHEQIWDMRQQGKNIAEIAKELGMGKGEVKLILDLYRQVKTSIS